ncbi:uncharacterized protein FPRO_14676 [Fusarium proliferatum ET1]|uniref:Uncharacterized protein n=1 Tax=Fusarium proliferatum (strain ET1) TaxID=1227346 RepID=A0A1L7VWW1_FUSPR|nr:uncharacterized protein FPRO_14676 [Fusarium proliferatum ET1]CZR44924.1 uncharacterized protein FPRO_14676 [Fusarium proliferatum ET1]
MSTRYSATSSAGTRSSSPHRQGSLSGSWSPTARAPSRLHNRQYLATHDINTAPPKTHSTGLAGEARSLSELTAHDRHDVGYSSYARSDDCPSLEPSFSTPPAKSRWSHSASSIQSIDTPQLDQNSETLSESSDLADEDESVMIMDLYRISCNTRVSTPTLIEIINNHETHSQYEDACADADRSIYKKADKRHGMIFSDMEIGSLYTLALL